MKAKLIILSFIALAACAEEPSPKEAEKAAEQAVAEDEAAALKSEQKSIEEAADAAAKLVEEESRKEIEQLKAELEQ